MPTPTLTPEMVELIISILHHGNQVEIKIEQGQITIIEIRRKMRSKGQRSTTGS